jgi:hypothetical protein
MNTSRFRPLAYASYTFSFPGHTNLDFFVSRPTGVSSPLMKSFLRRIRGTGQLSIFLVVLLFFLILGAGWKKDEQAKKPEFTRSLLRLRRERSPNDSPAAKGRSGMKTLPILWTTLSWSTEKAASSWCRPMRNRGSCRRSRIS